MQPVFVTGAGGFVGSRFVRALARRGAPVIALHKRAGEDRGGGAARCGEESPGVRRVAGDLLEPDSYGSALDGAVTVVHFAAATGAASKEEHFRVNLEGTERLIEQCARQGVRELVFVSTIAVKFADKRRYYYAQAKELAEAAVERSGLDWLIVRPTIVTGPGAPVLTGLRRLAELPLIPVFGSGRAVVQPVWVDDLVDMMLAALEATTRRIVVELGGPQRLTIEELLQAIRRHTRGEEGRALHVPLAPLLTVLGAAESAGIRGLPVTAGQLASFRFDGVAEPPEGFDRDGLKGIDEMLVLSLAE